MSEINVNGNVQLDSIQLFRLNNAFHGKYEITDAYFHDCNKIRCYSQEKGVQDITFERGMLHYILNGITLFRDK